jgi:hypothetical protein
METQQVWHGLEQIRRAVDAQQRHVGGAGGEAIDRHVDEPGQGPTPATAPLSICGGHATLWIA